MIFIFKVLLQTNKSLLPLRENKEGKKKIPKYQHLDGTEMQITPKVLSCRSRGRGEECCCATVLWVYLGFFCGVFCFYTKDLDSNPVLDCYGRYSRTEALKLQPGGPFPEGRGGGGLRSRRQYMGVFQESTCLFRLQKCRTINYTSVLQKISSITAGGAIHQP